MKAVLNPFLTVMTFKQWIELHPELDQLTLEEQQMTYQEYLDQLELITDDWTIN